MPAKNRADLKVFSREQIVEGQIAEEISPELHNQVNDEIIDSNLNKIDDLATNADFTTPVADARKYVNPKQVKDEVAGLIDDHSTAYDKTWSAHNISAYFDAITGPVGEFIANAAFTLEFSFATDGVANSFVCNHGLNNIYLLFQIYLNDIAFSTLELGVSVAPGTAAHTFNLLSAPAAGELVIVLHGKKKTGSGGLGWVESGWVDIGWVD